MEGGSGFNTFPNPNHIDKSRVLDVKPLRSLKPVFPSANQGPPFMSGPPFGPFPSGVSPFFPFRPPETSQFTPDPTPAEQTPPSFVQPLRAYVTPTVPDGPSEFGGPSSSSGRNGAKRGPGRPKGSTNVKKKKQKEPSSALTESSNRNFDSGISQTELDDGNREMVLSVLMRFGAVKRRLCQLSEAKRSSFKLAGGMMNKGVRTNMKRRIGEVPGVEVGDIFFFRMEMCLVGLHIQTMAGIDYMVVHKGEGEEDTLATSIVSSGHYDDDAEDPDSIIYSGQGGNADKNGETSDQKLERGNLALERSIRNNNVVRVIRGVKDADNQGAKIYIYDGLFAIKESWVEKGKSGCNTFKYKLVRLPGQTPAFAVWKSVQKWRNGLIPRTGLILPDLTSGAEKVPVSLVNDVDDEKGPAYFTYITSLRYSESLRLTQPIVPCTCRKSCVSLGNPDCFCILRNGGDLPYTGGTLVSRRPMIYECGQTCLCNVSCKNKLIQTGLKFRFEVFKTVGRGWGLRSWDPIRGGSFICEYAGEIKDKDDPNDEEEEDEYVFDTSRVYNSFRWNYEPSLIEGETSNEISEEFDLPSPLVISAKSFGNVARFMNHSCCPNVLWQPVAYERDGVSFIHIAFFALRHIPPMTELTYDYGVSRKFFGSEAGSSSMRGRKECLCGYEKCRGSYC